MSNKKPTKKLAERFIAADLQGREDILARMSQSQIQQLLHEVATQAHAKQQRFEQEKAQLWAEYETERDRIVERSGAIEDELHRLSQENTRLKKSLEAAVHARNMFNHLNQATENALQADIDMLQAMFGNVVNSDSE